MTSRDFAYWLQGFFELTEPKELTPEQTSLVRRHLALVFKHEIDPSMGDAAHQAKLDETHGATGPAKTVPNEHLRPTGGGWGPGVPVMRC